MKAFSSLSTAMLKGFYRDRLSLFFAILFPLFFIVIFGTVFANNGAARPQVIEIGAVPLIDTLPAEAKANLDQAVELVQGTSLDDALSQVQKGDADAVLQQQDDTILLTYSSADPVGAATVQGIFNAFVDQANIAVSGLPPTYTLQTNQVEDESLQPIQYIAPGMIGYGIAVGAVFGAALTLITWREKKLLRRLRLAPVSTATVVGSRVSVSIAVAIGQLVLFVAISVLPFLGLQLNGAWYMAVPLVICGTLAFLAIGLLVGSIAKTVGGRQRAGEPDRAADGVPVRRVHPARGGTRVAGDDLEVPADGLPGRGHEGRDGARRGTVGGVAADGRSCWPSRRW